MRTPNKPFRCGPGCEKVMVLVQKSLMSSHFIFRRDTSALFLPTPICSLARSVAAEAIGDSGGGSAGQ